MFQSLSGIPDDTTANEYRETCNALTKFGATSTTTVISGNFAFRYYCKANLYVTLEEGAAYQQLKRADVVNWYTQYLRSGTLSKTAIRVIFLILQIVSGRILLFCRERRSTPRSTLLRIGRLL